MTTPLPKEDDGKRVVRARTCPYCIDETMMNVVSIWHRRDGCAARRLRCPTCHYETKSYEVVLPPNDFANSIRSITLPPSQIRLISPPPKSRVVKE